MPIVRIDLIEGKSEEYRAQVGEIGYQTLVDVLNVPEAALGVGREEDDTGIFTMCVEIDVGQWAVGGKISTLFQLLDNLGGNVSEQRRAEMSARYPQKR